MLRRSHGFSLIELLLVITVMGILYALTIPVGNNFKESALKLKTKAQFTQYILALEAYKQEYGNYPNCIENNKSIELNLILEQFVRSLSGRNLDGSKLSEKDRKLFNKNEICFYNFPELPEDDSLIKDAFGNEKIFIITKANSEIIIPAECFEEKIRKFVPSRGLKSCIAVYSLPNEKFPPIVSWE